MHRRAGAWAFLNIPSITSLWVVLWVSRSKLYFRDLNVFLMHPSQWGASHSMCCKNIIQRLSRHFDRQTPIGVNFKYDPQFTFEKKPTL
jgi:hypothetical protein